MAAINSFHIWYPQEWRYAVAVQHRKACFRSFTILYWFHLCWALQWLMGRTLFDHLIYAYLGSIYVSQTLIYTYKKKNFQKNIWFVHKYDKIWRNQALCVQNIWFYWCSIANLNIHEPGWRGGSPAPWVQIVCQTWYCSNINCQKSDCFF